MKKIIKFLILTLILILGLACQSNTETLKNQSFEEIEEIIGLEINNNIILLDEINGFGVRYKISHPEIIDNKGKVSLPVFDTDVTITIILDVNGIDVTKDFIVKVKSVSTEEYKKQIKDYLYNSLPTVSNQFDDMNIKNFVIAKFNKLHTDLDNYDNNQDLNEYYISCKNYINELPLTANKIISTLEQLDILYLSFDMSNYSEENYQLLTDIYTNGKNNLFNQESIDDINTLYDSISKELLSVPIETLDDEKAEYIGKLTEKKDEYILNKYITEDEVKSVYEKYVLIINNAETLEEIVNSLDNFDKDLLSIKKEQFVKNLNNLYTTYKDKIHSKENVLKLESIYKDYSLLITLTSSFIDIITSSDNLIKELNSLNESELEFIKYKEESILNVQEIYNTFDKTFYSVQNNELLTTIYDEYKVKIELSLDKNEIIKFIIECEEKLSSVPKDIVEGLSNLINYYTLLKLNDYTDENKLILDNTFEEYTNKIKTAITTDEINNLYNEAINKLKSIEVIDNELIAYKIETLSAFKEYFNSLNKEEYTNENYDLVTNIYNKCISNVETVKSKEDVDNLIAAAKVEIEKIEKLDLVFEAYKKNTLNELLSYYNNIDKDSYNESNYNIITSLYNECKDNISNSTNLADIDSYVKEFKSEVESIEKEKTPIEKLFEIEEDIAYILDLSGMLISEDIILKTYSLYDSVITWKSSNEDVLTSTGIVGENVTKTKVTLSYQVLLDGITYDGVEIVIYVDTATVLPAYYNNIDLSLSGNQLKLQLRSLITTTHKTILSYGDLRYKNPITDVDPNNSNNLILFYMRTSVTSAWDGGSTWNREHVWPQSQGWFKTSGAGADIHHLRPTNPTANSTRGNNPYGEVANRDYYAKKVGSVVYGYLKGGYFEPLDEVKGDVARIILYLLVRYSEADSYSITNVIQSYDILLKWNESDPVDDFEKNRNEKSYEIQGNRNPFIDYPEFANMIYSSTTNISDEVNDDNYSITFTFFGKKYTEFIQL